MRRLLARRRSVGLPAVMLMTLALAQGSTALSAAAAAGGEPGTVTTSSSLTGTWTPRHPDDSEAAADRTVYDALKSWRLRVSQSRDLLNQSVEVSWDGVRIGDQIPYVQVMQCWSDGPQIEPTREQCAFGGVNDPVNDAPQLTRRLATDPRETTYRRDGVLEVVTLDGAVPERNAQWAESSALVLGTGPETCPAGTSGYSVTMAPPRSAVVSGATPASVVVQAPTAGAPPSLTRDDGKTFAAVTGSFDLAAVRASAGVTGWPVGRYRFELVCQDGSGAPGARFVGFLDRRDVTGSAQWRANYLFGELSVPFDPVGDTKDTAPTDSYEPAEVLEYLKPRTTNEVAAAIVRSDGSGAVNVELQTDLEAQHLACGRVDGPKVRSCWIVGIPRLSAREPPQPNATDVVSPLSQTIWDRRIALPLDFAPVALGCQSPSGLKQILSHDSALLAVRSWQPKLCANASTASSVVGVPDGAIRGGTAEPNRMGIATVPDPEAPATLVKAPVATSGVVIGFAIDRRIAPSDGSELNKLNGTPTTLMNLNPRLVTKLLTHSYDAGISGAAPNGARTPFAGSVFTPARTFPEGNPRSLDQDPEFLALNPDFALWLKDNVLTDPLGSLLVAFDESDAYQVLWRWILGDEDARRFLEGAPDSGGMRINPYYQGVVDEQTSSFPLLDPTCVDNVPDKSFDALPPLCQINFSPRVDDDFDAARAAIRGDTRRSITAPAVALGTPGEVLVYGPTDRQAPTRRAMLVVTTSAAAERFNLPTARLRDATGEFVAATAESMSRARSQMVARPDDVLAADPGKVKGGGYPLTTNSYAMVDVSATTQAQNNAFAAILDYAAGDGQKPGRAAGQLPPGYAPLSPELTEQTRKAATLLRDPSALLAVQREDADGDAVAGAVGSDEGDGDLDDGPGGDDLPDSSGGTGGDAGSLEPSNSGEAAELAAGGVSAAPAPASPRVAGALTRTSGVDSPLRWLVPTLLGAGLLAALVGRVLPLLRRPPSS